MSLMTGRSLEMRTDYLDSLWIGQTTLQTVDGFMTEHDASTDDDADAGHHKGVYVKECLLGAIMSEPQVTHAMEVAALLSGVLCSLMFFACSIREYF